MLNKLPDITKEVTVLICDGMRLFQFTVSFMFRRSLCGPIRGVVVFRLNLIVPYLSSLNLDDIVN